MADRLPSAVDAVSMAFTVVPTDRSDACVRRVASEVPALLKPVSKTPEKWIQSNAEAPFAFIDALGYICTAVGQKATIWRASGTGDPVEHTLRHPICCLGTLHYPPAEHILLFCTTQGLELLVARPCLRGGVQFLAVPIFMNTLPTEITCIKGTNAGKALLGGNDGNLYELKLTLAKTLMEDGFDATIVNLTWEWKKLLYHPAPIHQIYVDLERQLAYAVNRFCEMEVVSFGQGLLSDKPSRVAVQSNQEMQIVSYAVLPEYGFGEAVLLGVSATGKMYYFALDCPRVSPRDLSAEEITKRARTWCGIGLHKNLKLIHVNDGACCHLRESLAQGSTVEVVTVLQTTIYLSLYNHGDGMSTLWEMKNCSGRFQEIQPLPEISLKGRVVGMCPKQPLSLRLPGAQDLEKKLQIHELTIQYFYRAPEMTVYTSEAHQYVTRQWPCEALAEILERENLDQLTQFIESYGKTETSAMMVYLSLEGNRAAKQMLMKQEVLLEHMSNGVITYFKRWTEPIWLTEVFRCKNTGSILAPNQIMIVNLSSEVLNLFREVAKKLSSYLGEFLRAARVDVYESGGVYVNSTSGITSDLAKALMEFKLFPETFAQSMALLEFLSHQPPLSISKSKNRDLLREISLMSVRDFVCFGLTARPRLSEFIDEAKEQMSAIEAEKLSRFFKDNAPLLDPTPRQRKEDALDNQLPQNLKDLRKKIRSLNEKLSNFEGDHIEDREVQAALLREHYMPVLDVLEDLVVRITQAVDKAPLITEALKYVKVVLEVAHEETRNEMLVEFALSPLGDRRILSVDPAFEEPLRNAAGIDGGHVSHVLLSPLQQKATERLIGFYEMRTQYEEAAWLGVMLATQTPNPILEGPSLVARVKRFEEAQRNFELAGSKVDLTRNLRQLYVQKAALEIVGARYKDYDMDSDDQRFLNHLGISIVPPEDLKLMIQCWLEEDDGETRAAFQENREYKDLEDLIKAIV